MRLLCRGKQASGNSQTDHDIRLVTPGHISSVQFSTITVCIVVAAVVRQSLIKGRYQLCTCSRQARGP